MCDNLKHIFCLSGFVRAIELKEKATTVPLVFIRVGNHVYEIELGRNKKQGQLWDESLSKFMLVGSLADVTLEIDNTDPTEDFDKRFPDHII